MSETTILPSNLYVQPGIVTLRDPHESPPSNVATAMISHEHRIIFVHVPKTGGTSIETALGHIEGPLVLRATDHRPLRMIERPLLSPYMFASKANIYNVLRRVHNRYRKQVNPLNRLTPTREQYDSYFKFTFVRNPWSRAFSWYKGVMRDEIEQKKLKITRQLSLNEFLSLHEGRGALRPQFYWIQNYRGSIPLDYIGRFESIDEHLDEVCRRAQIPKVTLEVTNPGSGLDYREHYDDASRDLVAKVHKEEIALFGYTFES